MRPDTVGGDRLIRMTISFVCVSLGTWQQGGAVVAYLARLEAWGMRALGSVAEVNLQQRHQQTQYERTGAAVRTCVARCRREHGLSPLRGISWALT